MSRTMVAYVPHILFVGNSRVGKTSLIQKMSGIEVDNGASRPTIKSDFIERKMSIGVPPNKETIMVRLCDQQFEMGGSPNSIYRNRDIIVLVWSLSDMESYRKINENLISITNTTDSQNPDPPQIVLCANKCDESWNDNEYNLCKEKYKQYPNVKTSRDGTGIDKLEAIFCRILTERYIKKCDSKNKMGPSDGSFELSERQQVMDGQEPNCC